MQARGLALAVPFLQGGCERAVCTEHFKWGSQGYSICVWCQAFLDQEGKEREEPAKKGKKVQVLAKAKPKAKMKKVEDYPEIGDFVISLTGKRKLRRLHRVGCCWRTPGVDYEDYVVIPPPLRAEHYDVACKGCWAEEATVKSLITLGEPIESESSSTSSPGGFSEAEAPVAVAG